MHAALAEATGPAPIPCEAPVTMATLWTVMVTHYSTGGGLCCAGAGTTDRSAQEFPLGQTARAVTVRIIGEPADRGTG